MNTSRRSGIVLSAFLALAASASAAAQSCVGDIDADGVVNGADLGVLLSYWGPQTSDPVSVACDLDGNGDVDGADLGLLLSNWGGCPAPVVPVWATLVDAQPDPAVVTDPALRAAIVSTGLAWRVLDTATQIEMLLVPPGTFQMGCIMGSDAFGCYGEELPVHTVTLTQAFYLGRHEVTQAQWQAQTGSNPSFFQGFPDSPSFPVESVSWLSARAFCSSAGMRLPTEAEWEYACRAGTQTPFYNGSTDDATLGALAWYAPNSANRTHPVGGKAANAFGFRDMLGNAMELVNDWAGDYPFGPVTDPTGPTFGASAVTRGGSYFGESAVRSSFRGNVSPSWTFEFIGFRVARTP